jgi:hypothetical protein
MNCGEGHVCPLSDIVVSGPDSMVVPLFDAAGKCMNHWSGKQRVHKRKRRNPPKKKYFTKSACLEIVEDVLFGNTSRLAKQVMLTRASKRVAREVRAIKRPASFFDLQRIVSEARCGFSPVVRGKRPHCVAEKIADAVSKYMNAHPRSMSSTLEVSVCTWLTMLSTGIVKDGTTVVHVHRAVTQHIPPPSLMSLVPRVQCRAISVAIRHFKSYVFTAEGGVIQSRVFHNGACVV